MEYFPKSINSTINSINKFLTLLELKICNLPKRAQQLCARPLLIPHHETPLVTRVETKTSNNLGIFPGEAIKMLVLLPGSGCQTDGECCERSCPSPDPPGIHKNQIQRWIF